MKEEERKEGEKRTPLEKGDLKEDAPLDTGGSKGWCTFAKG